MRHHPILVGIGAAAILSVAGAVAVNQTDATPKRLEGAKITRVWDGDTVRVKWTDLEGEHQDNVRILGVDTPESTIQHECGGKEASAFAHHFLPLGTTVDVLGDSSQPARDKYNRRLGYLYVKVDGHKRLVDYSALLIRMGLGGSTTPKYRVSHSSYYDRLERAAKKANLGLWAHCPPGTTL